MTIKNIAFDIGNVLLKWDPYQIVRGSFADHPDQTQLTKDIYKTDVWPDLNKGLMTEAEAINQYSNRLKIDIGKLTNLLSDTRESLVPINGSVELLMSLRKNYSLYCITDNVREIVAYLLQKYDFFQYFKDIIVSAEFGVLKPNPILYQALLTRNHLVAEETLFIDDMPHNAQGAIDQGMSGIIFRDADQCKDDMTKLGIVFDV